MKIMLLGDVHGNTKFVLKHVIPAAVEAKVDWIYQLGDFGYWEHTDKGVNYLDVVNNALAASNLNIVFIQGNHDKVSLIPQKYHSIAEFYQVRSAIWFAPNGTVWSPNDGITNFIALGGAYSLDKQYRLEEERAISARHTTYNAIQGWQESSELNTAGTLWFPEEEMTDEEFSDILTNTKADIDVILAHDKPLSSNPPSKLSPVPECQPNQRRLQAAINMFQPKLFVHGHLHVRYTDDVRCGDDNLVTRVEGLGADVPNYNQSRSSWEPSDAWEILTL
jgi:calcineurin-like phosphoesterase family protein